MIPNARRFLPALAGVMLLVACGSGKDAAAGKDGGDPAVSGALSDQIMVDPDLAGQNQSNAGLAGGGPATAEMPPEHRGPEAIAAAKAEATKLAGGSIRTAPSPASNSRSHGDVAATAAQIARQAQGAGANCPDKVEYSAAWATRLPAALTVYPRSHVQEAAGTDKDGCRLRVVNFVTPVGLSDVIDFYFTRLRAAGYDAEHRLEGKDHVLGGRKSSAAYVIYARRLESGLTEVDLVANGG